MLKAVGFILNRQNPKAVLCAETAVSFLQRNNINCFYPQESKPDYEPDRIITFGGDGTLLIGARYALYYQIPLLGINLGTVGFLTEVDPVHLEDSLLSLIESRYKIESRSLLYIMNKSKKEQYYALNDAVITRGGYARLIKVDAYVNRKEYGTFTADGIIVSTPTGSTGYSLSAGGPIVEPDMNCMIITPVCAHSMQHCPCVVSEKSEIRLLLNPGREQTAELQIDGQNKAKLRTGDEIIITGTDKTIQLIRLRPYDFFGLMRQKLIEWGS